MIRRSTLSLLLTAIASIASLPSFAGLITNYGDNTPYSLASTDSLVIASGTYGGSIGSFPAGAKIHVADGAAFNPSAFPSGNTTRGTIWVYGYMTIPGGVLTTNTDFTLHNYGTASIPGALMRGKNQVWINHYGGTLNFTGMVTMNGAVGDDNNVLTNYETINFSNDFQMNSGSAFYNYKDVNISGNMQISGGTFSSQGKVLVTGSVLLNNGASVIRNYCRMEVSGGIRNTSGNFYNYSYLRAINSDIENSGSGNIINLSVSVAGSPLSKPMIDGRNFLLSGGTITGPALMYFTNTTSITGGSMGVVGATADTIKMYDITRSIPAQILDVQSGGTINPNVIYNAWGVPDPTYIYLFGCSLETFLEIPLAVNWRSFDVILTNNTPLLLWTAEFDNKTVFEIQRSYDARNFTTIDLVPGVNGQNDYRYTDRTVDKQQPTAYYRIRAIEQASQVKMSQIRFVNFDHKGSKLLQIAPNPFTSDFFVNYQSADKDAVTVKIYNINGQQKMLKNVPVSKGFNRINITEAANFASGLYVVQIVDSRSGISTSKIIKQ